MSLSLIDPKDGASGHLGENCEIWIRDNGHRMPSHRELYAIPRRLHPRPGPLDLPDPCRGR